MYPSRKENVQNDYIFAREENAPVSGIRLKFRLICMRRCLDPVFGDLMHRYVMQPSASVPEINQYRSWGLLTSGKNHL